MSATVTIFLATAVADSGLSNEAYPSVTVFTGIAGSVGVGEVACGVTGVGTDSMAAASCIRDNATVGGALDFGTDTDVVADSAVNDVPGFGADAGVVATVGVGVVSNWGADGGVVAPMTVGAVSN